MTTGVMLAGAAFILLSSALAYFAFSRHCLAVRAKEFSTLTEAIPQLVFVTNAKGKAIAFNERWSLYTGYRIGSTNTWEMLVHADDVATSKKAWLDSVATGTAFETEYRLRSQEGSYRWFLVRALPLKKKNGVVDRWFGTCTDIEDKKANEASFRQLADSMPQIVWTARADGYLDYCNERWYAFTGFQRDGRGDSSWLPILHPEDAERCLALWYNCVRTGTAYQIEYRFWDKKSESYRWHLGRALPQYDDSGKISRWFGTCTDIDDQKQLEIEQRKFYLIIEKSSDFVGVCDINKNVVFVNKAGLNMVGMSDFHTSHVSQYFLPEDYRHIEDTVMPRALATGKWEGESHFYNSVLGTRVPVWMSAFPILDPTLEKAVGLVTVSHSLAERKNAEEERIRLLSREQAANEATAMKSAFLATASHEIRTPLAGIIGMAGLLLRSHLDARQLECANTLHSTAELLLHLLNDILDLSKVEAGKLTLEEMEFDLSVVLREVSGLFETLAEAKNIALRSDFPVRPLWIRADPTRLRQILNNFLSNAVKFTDEGQVQFSVRAEEAPDGNLAIDIEVRDSGIGLTDEAKQRLFQTFSQADPSIARKYGGTGLGLAVSKRILDLMGGTVSVESALNRGSCFHIQLSVPQGAPVVLDPASCKPTRRRVLVVDDNPLNIQLARILLEDLGQEVLCAQSGQEALRIYSEQAVDLILMDIQMPEMDGLETAARIRSLDRYLQHPTPIVALSAHAAPELHAGAVLGLTGYLSKPFRREAFIQVLRNCSSNKPAQH
jgi:PAS domain S-box-containing protein